MGSLNISVNIAGRTYRLVVENEQEEEIIRKAVADVNEKIKVFADNYSFKDNQDLLAMVVLDIATRHLSGEQMTSEQKEEVKTRLMEINNIL